MRISVLILIFMAIATAIVTPFIGKVVYTPFCEGLDRFILINLRLPRVLCGMVVGVALSISGVVMQNIFRNPLAEPYILGVSTGAGLGALLGFVLGVGIFFIPALAFTSAILTVTVVYNLAKVKGIITTESLLLSGIAVNFFLYALEWLILVKTNAHLILGWLVGYLGNVLWDDFFVILLSLPPALAVYVYSKHMNALLLGEESAHYLGVDVKKVVKMLIALATLATSVTVSVAGIIGFVGLMIPHIGRAIVGEDNRYLIPVSALIGAIFLTWADVFARILDIPVGIITMLCGGPFFVYIMRAKRL